MLFGLLRKLNWSSCFSSSKRKCSVYRRTYCTQSGAGTKYSCCSTKSIEEKVWKARKRGIDFLSKLGIETADLESELFLSHVLQCKHREQFLLLYSQFHNSLSLSSSQVQQFNRMLQRRASNEPVSYILGTREFWSLPFIVNSHTLIPRPSTETIVETAVSMFERKSKFNVLDIGTGSGCILLSILHEFPNASGLGVDVSSEALKVATENSQRLKLNHRASFVQSNWLDNVNQQFELIVSNPPYVSEVELPTLDPSVKEWEPKVALLGGSDGLQCYQSIATALQQKPATLKNGGILLCEIGAGLQDKVKYIFESAQLKYIGGEKDISGIERCLKFRKDS